MRTSSCIYGPTQIMPTKLTIKVKFRTIQESTIPTFCIALECDGCLKEGLDSTPKSFEDLSTDRMEVIDNSTTKRRSVFVALNKCR